MDFLWIACDDGLVSGSFDAYSRTMALWHDWLANRLNNPPSFQADQQKRYRTTLVFRQMRLLPPFGLADSKFLSVSPAGFFRFLQVIDTRPRFRSRIQGNLLAKKYGLTNYCLFVG